MSDEKRVGLIIDGVKVDVPECTNVLRAAEQAGVAIPHFCYHPGLA
ncbi:MAG: 2Fe-2S iron-sulfur cluster binding domain, partial [Candidatus Aminicenantes bacterium]|nr:2Fe-2S iron-sulfur cluster binding domain [Candidatus Aminicenantes bacterium]